MYSDTQGRKQESPLTLRTFGIALALHVAAGLALWGVAKIVWRTPEVIIPIDMTIVPPWAEVDPDDPDPDPNPPPEPKQEEPKPKPTPKPEVPKVEKIKQDAVVKEVEKPKKPEFKKAELKKPEKKKPEKKKPEVKPGDFKKRARLHKNIPRNLPRGKGTSREKPLSQEEIMKALNAGARYGASNQLAANEAQRCFSLVAAALKRHWTEEFQWNQSLLSVHLELHLGAGGRIKDARIVRSSGDAQVDRSVLLAAKNTGSIPGLSQSFLEQYSVFVIEMKPTRR